MKNLIRKKEDFYKEKKGFTLVETVIYIGIVSIIFLSLISFILFIKDNQKDFSIKWNLNRESQKIFSIFEILINDSNAISSPVSGDSFSSVTFSTRDLNNNPTTIYLFEGNLIMDKNGVLEIINSSEIQVTDFQVYNISNNQIPEIISLKLILSATSSDNILYSENFYSSFSLRDYAN